MNFKKKWVLYVLGVFLFLVIAACSSSDKNVEEMSAEELYMKTCSSCHGSDLKSGYATDLDQIGSTYTAEELEDIIVNGKNRMPGGILKGESAKKVAEWLAEQK